MANKRQKIQWIFLASVILGAVGFLGLLILGARWEKLYSIKKELYGLNNQIQSIESVLNEGSTWDDQIKAYLAKSQKLNDMFPQKEDQSLGILSDVAQANNLEVLSVKSQPKVAFLNADQQEVIVDGKKCHTVTISLHMKGKYRDLVGYLLAVKKTVPAYVTVEGLQLKKFVATSSALDISLEIKIYLLA